MDYEAINALMGQKRDELGQRYAKMPEMEANIRASMFGDDPVTKNLNSQEQSKIDELFSHDQAVANQYKTPPEAGQILDPYIRELQLTNRYRGTAKDLTTIRQGRDDRKDVIGDSLANALKLATQSLEMKKLELDQLSKDRDFAWEVYKEKNKKGSGGSAGNTAQSLFNTILGLQEKVQAAAPGKEGRTVRKVGQTYDGKKLTQSQLVSEIKKQNKGKTVRYTLNKDGTISYSVDRASDKGGNKQFFMEAPEAAMLDEAGGFEGMINKLGTAAVANGASTADVQSILNYFGGSVKSETRGQQQDFAIQELSDDLQQFSPEADPGEVYLQLKSAYPEVPDSTIKLMMNSAGFVII